MLELGRDICGDAGQALRREWLVTNGQGSYACGTVAGANTRCYHGVLVAALAAPVGRTLLVARIEATAHLRGAACKLDTNEWADGSIEPPAYQLIESFQLDGTIPTWTFALAEAQLVRRVWMPHGQPTTFVTYTHARGTDPIGLDLKVLCTYRDHHNSTTGDWMPTVTHSPTSLRVDALDEVPPYFVKIERGTFTPTERWYHKFKHRVETERGLDDVEDLYAAGQFHVTLEPGETIAMVASTLEKASLDWQTALYAERKRQKALIEQSGCEDAPDWIRQLVLAADQFIVDRTFETRPSLRAHPERSAAESTLAPRLRASASAGEDATTPGGPPGRSTGHGQQSHLPIEEIAAQRPVHEAGARLANGLATPAPTGRCGVTPPVGKSVIAGYHWFGDWGRDTMIALPGLCLTTKRYDIARTILRTFTPFVDRGMLPNRFPDQGEKPEYNTIDATLWYFHAIDQVVAATADWTLVRDLYPVLTDILAWHVRGTRYNIHVDKDGLLYGGDPTVQLTWMDAKVDDWVVTPRIGKPVEINALWIHALRIMTRFARQLGFEHAAADYTLRAEQAAASFARRFWYAEGGYLYDVIDGPTGNDASLRPNQLFALSLKPTLLSHDAAVAVVNVCAKELLTSFGLRSLAPAHADYQGKFTGDRYARDGAYHQGTVWGWLIGPFVEAHFAVFKDPVAALSYLDPFEQHLRDLGLGTISEVFEGDAPHLPKGCVAQAWSVAEVLRLWKALTSNGSTAPHV